MNESADETSGDVALMIATLENPVARNPEEETAGVQTCEYCGHCPCGCGG